MILYLEPANASEVEIFLLDADLEAFLKAHMVRFGRYELFLIVLPWTDIHFDIDVGGEEGVISLDSCPDLHRGGHGTLRKLSLVGGIVVCRSKWLLLLCLDLLPFLEELT
jgi:hypothetical protein